MDYFAGLDISMDETHICVLDREGEVVHQGKAASTAQATADAAARSDARGREQTTARILLHAANRRSTAISTGAGHG